MASITCSEPFVGNCLYSTIQLATPGGTTLIRTGMGTGKTTALMGILEEASREGKRWLCVVPRVSIAEFMKTLVEERQMRDVVCYRDVRGPLYHSGQVICSVDSLHRLAMHDETTGHLVTSTHFDLVVLDEVGTTVSHFPATTVARPRAVWNIMRAQLNTAGRVIMMDAHLREHHWRAFARLSSRRHAACVQIVPEEKSGGGVVTFLRSEATLRDEIVDCVSAGRRAVVVSTRKDWLRSAVVDVIRRADRPLDCVVITAGGDDSGLKRLLQERDCITADLVGYTPKIGPAVDVTAPGYDTVYVCAAPGGCDAHQVMQMMGRFRSARNYVVYAESTQGTAYDKNVSFSTPGAIMAAIRYGATNSDRIPMPRSIAAAVEYVKRHLQENGLVVPWDVRAQGPIEEWLRVQTPSDDFCALTCEILAYHARCQADMEGELRTILAEDTAHEIVTVGEEVKRMHAKTTSDRSNAFAEVTGENLAAQAIRDYGEGPLVRAFGTVEAATRHTATFPKERALSFALVRSVVYGGDVAPHAQAQAIVHGVVGSVTASWPHATAVLRDVFDQLFRGVNPFEAEEDIDLVGVLGADLALGALCSDTNVLLLERLFAVRLPAKGFVHWDLSPEKRVPSLHSAVRRVCAFMSSAGAQLDVTKKRYVRVRDREARNLLANIIEEATMRG